MIKHLLPESYQQSVGILLLCLILGPISTQAQLRLGPIIGLNVADLAVNDNGTNFDPNARTGILIGAIVEVTLTEDILLGSGLIFSSKGWERGVTLPMNYVEIPITGIYRYPLDNGVVLFGQAGPYIAFGIGGKDEDGDKAFGEDSFFDFNRFDLGLFFGVGAEFDAGGIPLQVRLGYDLGIADVASSDLSDRSARTRTFMITVAAPLVTR